MAYTPTPIRAPINSDLADGPTAFANVNTDAQTNFTAIKNELAKWDPLLTGAAFNILVGNPSANTDYSYVVQRLYAPDLWALKFHIGDNNNQRIVLMELTKGGAEQAQMFYRTDGMLYTKTGGAAGISRPHPFAIWAGSVQVNVANKSYGTYDLRWANVGVTGRFTQIPNIWTTSHNSIWMTGTAAGWDATGGPIYARSYNNSNGGPTGVVDVAVLAVQMLPGASQG